MSKINLAMAIEITLFNQLIANSVIQPDGTRVQQDFPEEDYAEFQDFKFNFWKDVTSPNGTFKVVSFYLSPITVSNSDASIKLVSDMITKFGAAITPVGAWNMDGSQYGTTITPAEYDMAGTLLTPEIVSGTPVYPVHPLVMAAMPDDVTYDDKGVELTRQPASAYKDVNLMSGQVARRWV